MTTTTTLDSSSSLAESTSMDDAATTTNHTTANRRFRPKTAATGSANRRYGADPCGGGATGRIGEGSRNRYGGGEDVDAEAEEEGDVEVWSTFSESFRQVQSVLDRNRALIQQVNENHRSNMSNNLVNNVALIQEINGNISKVVSLYSDLSSDFSSMFHQRKESASNNNDQQFNDGSQ